MRAGVRTKLAASHVLASTAMPVFFPPVEICGRWYADGSLGLTTPLSPAIHMGARRIIAIAVRSASTAPWPKVTGRHPCPADTAGLLLNTVFADALGPDVERALRINQTLRLVPDSAIETQLTALRLLDVLVLRPSVDPATLVLHTLSRLPRGLRHLFRGLGASDDAGWDLLSYLGFDGAYTARLVELGYEDTTARATEIRAFLSGAQLPVRVTARGQGAFTHP